MITHEMKITFTPYIIINKYVQNKYINVKKLHYIIWSNYKCDPHRRKCCQLGEAKNFEKLS